MKPPWQPQPPPPAQVDPGVMEGRNGRPAEGGSRSSTPKPYAGQITTQQKPSVAPPGQQTYSFKVASPVYPEIAPDRPTYNPITGEWVMPEHRSWMPPRG